MKAPLKTQIRTQISALTGFNFQNFIVEMFLLTFGSDGFTPIRRVKDKSCDGIFSKDKTILAAYGPNTYTKKQFEEKVDSDFDGYKKNWQSKFPHWRFIVNHDLSPNEVLYVETLHQEIWGLEQIVAFIETLNSATIRELASILRIDVSDFLANDYLEEILSDLLRVEGQHIQNLKYKPKDLTEIGEKLILNYSEEVDLASVKEEYPILSSYFGDVDALLGGYGDSNIDKIKVRVINDFGSTNGESFKEKFDELTKNYQSKYSSSSDDDYLLYVRVILMYMFEQCFIGKRK